MPATAWSGAQQSGPPNEVGNVTVIARVLPEHRRQGYGGKLFFETMKLAAA
ncbi:MAG TPA: GNAT family N-acetyltransferase [Acidimicrobiales bacterium]|nr:GNAT family N-acetyltransferase [Acidimicrobiales bacterium]